LDYIEQKKSPRTCASIGVYAGIIVWPPQKA